MYGCLPPEEVTEIYSLFLDMLTIEWMPKSSRKQSSHLPSFVIILLELGYDNCAAAPESKTPAANS